MKKIKIETVNSLSALLLLLVCSCNKLDHKEEVITIVDKANNAIEKGLLVNGKREGYWVVFDTNYVIQFDIQYFKGIPNGKSTHFAYGSIFIEAEYKEGKRDGKYTSYHKYPIISTQGNVKMGKSIGEWRTYARDGRLNSIIKYDNDTFKIILDNKIDDFVER